MKIVEKLRENSAVTVRTISNGFNVFHLCYIRQINNTESISHFILKPLESSKRHLSPDSAAKEVLCLDTAEIRPLNFKLIDDIYDGSCVIFFEGYNEVIWLNTKRTVPVADFNPQINFSIKGPKDSFTENIDGNISLLRYRIKHPRFIIEPMKIGQFSKSSVCLCYIDGITDKKYLKILKQKLKKINTKGIFSASELAIFLQNSKYFLFPECGIEQRSDNTANAIIEGKIAILVEGSGTALILPKVFVEFLWSSDDEYENIFFGMFSKTLRLLSLIICVSITPLYVAITTFHPEILPTNYAIFIASTRTGVPFSPFFEALLLEIIIEILRESIMRVPSHIGSAIGIVGGIVIGQASVSAGVFSPLIMICGAMSLLSSFAISDFSLINPLRLLKFMVIIFTSLFGLLGFIFGIYFIIIIIGVRTKSFSASYLTPISPFNKFDFSNIFFSNKKINTKPPQSY